MLGAADEQVRTELLLANWPGPKLNLCGQLSVRQSAAVLTHARVYLGHDSGPMHLAAAVGIPCVAVFSSRNLLANGSRSATSTAFTITSSLVRAVGWRSVSSEEKHVFALSLWIR